MKKHFYPDKISDSARIMLFVDGENLAIGYERLKEKQVTQTADRWNTHEKGCFLWRSDFSARDYCPPVWRTFYYSSVSGEEAAVTRMASTAKACGIEAPSFFWKRRGAKR